jgi:hypothetical protein
VTTSVTVARELLADARRMLDRSTSGTSGLWPRAAVLLARQSLEVALNTCWSAKAATRCAQVSGPAFDNVPASVRSPDVDCSSHDVPSNSSVVPISRDSTTPLSHARRRGAPRPHDPAPDHIGGQRHAPEQALIRHAPDAGDARDDPTPDRAQRHHLVIVDQGCDRDGPGAG